MNLKIREPLNALTHLAGVVFFGIGWLVLMMKAQNSGDYTQIIAILVYGMGLLGLYTASTIYHWFNGSEESIKLLKKTDHSMIYIFIAATYTPICMISLRGLFGTALLVSVWFLAIVGVVFKFIFINLPRWLYTSFYLILGWVAVFAIYPLAQRMAMQGIVLLIIGGIFYTIGAVIYALKPKSLTFGLFGFHEIFHLFILAGSLMHFVTIYWYVMN